MRIYSFLIFFLMTMNVPAVEVLDFKKVDKLFEEAGYPTLEHYVESAISGRCLHKFEPDRTKASVILISLGEKGFELAPLVLHNQPVDFFDDLSWHDVFALFPEAATQFYELVSLPSIGLGLIRKDLLDTNKAEIREHANYFIIKTFRNDKFYRYCYYQKSL